MPLFILISEFVTKYSRPISDGKGLWKYVNRRTVAYMLPWAVWSFLVRGMSDSGFAIILRAATSLAGCIAVCGLCKGIFSSKIGGGTLAWVGEHSLEVYLTHYPQLDQAGQGTNSIQSSGARHGFGQLYDYGGTYCDGNSDGNPKCGAEICVNRKEKVSKFFLWAGKQSLEIYMMHGLLLNIFKSSVAIQFSSIEGYLLTTGNFALTVGLCAVVIHLLNQNAVLKKVLNIR